MDRRAYLQSVGTVSLSAIVGCIGEQSGSGQSHAATPEETAGDLQNTRVSDNRAVISYNNEDYRDVFDYEPKRSRDRLTTSPARQGSALQVPIPEGKHRGMRMRFWMTDHFQREPDAASATYWLYVPSDFSFAKSHSGGGKLPGFQGTYGKCGDGSLGPCNGTNGWSARISYIRPKAAYIDTDFGLAFYVYHGEMSGEPSYPYGTYLRWNRGLNFDQWHRIDQFVKMNTPGVHDGVLRGWVDGELAVDRDGMLFRREGHENIHIQEFVNTVYFGGEWSSPQDNTFYFDDLEIRIAEGEGAQVTTSR